MQWLISFHLLSLWEIPRHLVVPCNDECISRFRLRDFFVERTAIYDELEVSWSLMNAISEPSSHLETAMQILVSLPLVKNNNSSLKPDSILRSFTGRSS